MSERAEQKPLTPATSDVVIWEEYQTPDGKWHARAVHDYCWACGTWFVRQEAHTCG